jgi:CBS-domain-containing membrane protein
MGATSFIVFALPKADSAQTRNVVGGHFVGMLCGAVFYLFIPAPYWLEYPLVVGIAIFLMVALDFEHPPAVGTALAVVFNEINPQIFAIIIVSSIVLSQVRFYSRKFLKDLV